MQFLGYSISWPKLTLESNAILWWIKYCINNRMLYAKKVRLSLALLTGRVVRIVGVCRGNLDSVWGLSPLWALCYCESRCMKLIFNPRSFPLNPDVNCQTLPQVGKIEVSLQTQGCSRNWFTQQRSSRSLALARLSVMESSGSRRDCS